MKAKLLVALAAFAMMSGCIVAPGRGGGYDRGYNHGYNQGYEHGSCDHSRRC